MDPSFQVGGEGANSLQVLWEDSDRVFCRGVNHADAKRTAVLAVVPVAEPPSPASLDRLAHELGLTDELDAAWAVRPLELKRDRGRTMLVLEDPGGEPLARRLGSPLAVGRFLPLAIGIAAALGKVHHRGLIHKDIKPANIVVGCADGQVRLTGFGIASRLPRERQAPEAPEIIAGTLPYMAPEQTGRMNRSIDARSDLYALGVTLYQMLTGVLPFTAADPMAWVHCHIARQPVPPSERLQNVPAPVSAIIMKLLAKTPEARYQSAGGLERDLRRCLAEWEARRRIDDFPLGLQDTPNRLVIPEKLYGREREIATLLACFDRVVKNGAPELVLVSGYSGIGKSSVVNELHRVLVPPRGLFASGKFDQYKRDIPYATLVQAFQSLVRPLLSKSDAELASWRHTLLEALGPNGRLMVDLIPELKLIIGDQPPAPELPAQQAQSRFQLVFQRFIGVFARPEHPLALFLDDLQWLDAATLDLLEDLLTRSALQHLLLIGAYRDNEVTAAHPLMRKLDAIKTAGGKVAEITLAPLAREHLGQLIADAVRCELERAAPLAELVHGKTGGNPFFAIQFLSSLAEEAFLTVDQDGARWSWDLDRIHAKGYTDNVVDLMVGKLSRLPAEAQNALQQMACLGNIADITTLAIVLGITEEQVDTALWLARRHELVERTAAAYRFSHDRVQEAAYSLIPEELRGEAHLRIGRLLAAHTPPEKEEAIFDIVNQLNRGAALIASRDEREQLAELNLLAGKRAKASTAYVSALGYLAAGRALLGEDAWSRHYRLTFDLERHWAECEFVTGALGAAEERLEAISAYAATLVDEADIVCLSMLLYFTTGRSDRAVDAGLAYLRRTGITWPAHPAEAAVRREYRCLRRNLARRPLASLIDLPAMTDPDIVAIMDVLTGLFPAAHSVDRCLLELVLLRMSNLSLEHGNCDSSSVAYSALNMVLGPRFADYRTAYDLGQLACELVDRRGMDRYKARVYSCVGSFAMPWTKPLLACQPMLRLAFTFGTSIGDMAFAAYTFRHFITNLLASGVPLADVQREAETALAFARTAGIGLSAERFVEQLRLIRTLRGIVSPEWQDDDWARENVEHLPGLAMIVGFHWVFRLQERYLAGDIAGALGAAARVAPIRWAMRSCFEEAEYEFYAALTRAAACEGALPEQRGGHLRALREHLARIRAWGENCQETFAHREALVRAELMRLRDRELGAEQSYEEAIRLAHENGFVQNEALAYELAARFYATRGFDEIAHLYLRNARHCYLRWGADGKVQQLDAMYPQLREHEPAPSSTRTIGTPVEHLDLATVIKVSQAVSGEIVQEKLLETLMRTAIEQAGAERGLLILSQGGEQRIAAEATPSGDMVSVRLRDEPVAPDQLPLSMLHYVLRTRESVILDDAAAQSPFAADDYIRQQQARSVLCLPLLNQAKVIGVLYLENNLAPRVFAPARIAVLKLLASQAAISLENTRLYRDLAEREARIRRLVDSDVIGIVIWDLDGRLIDANDAFLRMVQYARADLKAGLRWFDMTPPEWQEAHVLEEAEELKTTGMMRAREKEFFRKDGSRVPVLIGAAAFETQPDQGVAYILDLTERKRAEAEARESERRYREVQMELAHASRVATMGQLTGSIAHEISQPVGATVINAQAALRWLARQPPDLDEVCHALSQIVKNGTRAGEVIGRIRDLIKKAPPRQDVLEINGSIREVIELTRNEAMKNRVCVEADLADGLPLICGDRVQLQQVMLNLILNAVEAMSGVGDGAREVLIRTGQAAAGEVLVAVRDTGPGLDLQSIERVFEAFYTTKPSGMGMGLSICRSIVEAHGGRLWASASEPRGALFQFTLPPWDEIAPDLPPRAWTPVNSPSARPARV